MSDEREPVPYDVLKKGLRCPQCASPMTGHVAIEEGTRPKDEDYTICWYCEGLLQYSKSAFGWTLGMTAWPSGNAELMLMLSDLYGRMRASKSAGGRAPQLGPDVAERDGQR